MARRTKDTAGQAAVLIGAAVAAVVLVVTTGSTAAAPVRYQTTPAALATVADQISSTGTVAAQATLDLAFGAGNLAVTSVLVTPGQAVGIGQLLATVDGAAASLQVAAAQAQVALATAQAAATPAVADSTSMGHTSLTSADQELAAAQAALAATRLVAPQAGIVSAVNLGVGSLPGQPAIEMRSAAMNVQVPVQEQDAPYVETGQPVRLTFPALGVTGTGTVAAAPLEPAASTASPSDSVVTYPVTVTIVDPPPGLLLGMSAQADWTPATRDNVLAVPTSAIQSADSGYVVRVLVAGKPSARPVTIGMATTSLTQVVGGLTAGTPVLTGVDTS